jgi:hypothetical protein
MDRLTSKILERSRSNFKEAGYGDTEACTFSFSFSFIDWANAVVPCLLFWS